MKVPAMFAAMLGVAFYLGTGHAAMPTGAPAGSTAQCKDGSWYAGAQRKGACKGHEGLKTGFGSEPVAEKSKSAAPDSAAVPAVAKSDSPKAARDSTIAAQRAAAPGGGPGMV